MRIVANIKDHRFPRNMTMLHRAALSRNPERVRLLLSLNAPVNIFSQSGMTPLDIARKLHGDRSTVVQLLQEHGALPGAAIRARQTEKNKRRREKYEALKKEAQRREAELVILASVGNAEGVRRLIGLGVNSNARDEHGNTALIVAARNGYYNMVVFLENGAQRDITNHNGQTAYALAHAMGHLGIAVLVDPDTHFGQPNPHIPFGNPLIGRHMTDVHPILRVTNGRHW